MNDDPPSRRHRTPLSSECRAFVRAGLDVRRVADPALRAHVAQCAFCAARGAASIRLGAAVATRPIAPSRLHSPAFLDGIRTRIVGDCEESTTGRLLEQHMPVAAPAAADSSWPADLLESDLARRAVRRPDPAMAADWARVKASVLESLGAGSARDHGVRVARNRALTLAGVAAAAIICTWFVAGGSRASPEIVIADVVSMPEVEFSPMIALRRGESR